MGVGALGNYAFVFGNFGAPALGLEGSALASVLTALFMLAAYVVAIERDRRLRRYRLFGNWWRSEWQRFGELLRTGLPVAANPLWSWRNRSMASFRAISPGRSGAMALPCRSSIGPSGAVAGKSVAATIEYGTLCPPRAIVFAR